VAGVGNFTPASDDNVDVDCQTCREALSARIDGEDEPAPADRTDAHLAGCPSCRAWQERAVASSRTLRVREVTPVPDLTDVIMATAPTPVDTRGWWPRLLLGGVAVAQIGLGLSQMLSLGATAADARHGGLPVASHLFNESTAWNLALGVGLFWAVFRPRATAGLIPMLGGFLLVLIAYSTHDLITGAAPLSRVLGHGLLVAGLCLLIVVNRQSPDRAPHRSATGDDLDATSPPEVDAPARPDGEGHRPPLRPAGRHRAA
jgi:predicted anti-sigma-YlaC factor YlaD